MARRNQNTFLKRQKEMERVRKAREKMARRHGKKLAEAEPAPAPAVDGSSPEDGGEGEIEGQAEAPAAASEDQGAAAATGDAVVGAPAEG